MKHATARNVIKRIFGLLTFRWKILFGPSSYNTTTQKCIINAYCLHNFIRREKVEDLVEDEVNNLILDESTEDYNDNIIAVEPTNKWIQFKADMATAMLTLGNQDEYNNWDPCTQYECFHVLVVFAQYMFCNCTLLWCS